MTNTKHTPTPWAIVPTVDCTRHNIFGRAVNQEYHIGTLQGGSIKDVDIAKANAAFIVRACNAHEELTEALKWALGVITTCEENAHNIDWSIGHFGRKGKAQAALAKAGA